MERTRKIENGHIVVKNPLYQELPKHEVVIIRQDALPFHGQL